MCVERRWQRQENGAQDSGAIAEGVSLDWTGDESASGPRGKGLGVRGSNILIARPVQNSKNSALVIRE